MASDGAPAKPRPFSFVYIPADDRPMEQWSLTPEPGQEVECLMKRLQARRGGGHLFLTSSVHK